MQPSLLSHQHTLEVIPSHVGESRRQCLSNVPLREESLCMLLLVDFEDALEPRISPRDVVQLPSFVCRAEDASVLPELKRSIPINQSIPRF